MESKWRRPTDNEINLLLRLTKYDVIKSVLFTVFADIIPAFITMAIIHSYRYNPEDSNLVFTAVVCGICTLPFIWFISEIINVIKMRHALKKNKILCKTDKMSLSYRLTQFGPHTPCDTPIGSEILIVTWNTKCNKAAYVFTKTRLDELKERT